METNHSALSTLPALEFIELDVELAATDWQRRETLEVPPLTEAMVIAAIESGRAF